MLKNLHKVVRGLAIGDGGPGFATAWSGPPGSEQASLLQKTLRGRHKSPPRCILEHGKRPLCGLLGTVIALIFVSIPALSAPVTNQATLDYLNTAGIPSTLTSNVVTSIVRTASSIELTRIASAGPGLYQETVGPSACFQGGAYVNLGNPTLVGGTTIDPALVQRVNPGSEYNLGESAFIRLQDSDQNTDVTVIEYAQVTVSHSSSGDSEIIRLTETGVNTGVFAGYIPTSAGPATASDCVLQGTMDSSFQVRYVDSADSLDTSQVSAALDPASVVFESRTGTTINNATIELVDAATGMAAVVYGNDGVSIFPSSIISGTTVIDSSGTNYLFGPGEYRFPVVPAGSYRIIVTPPPGYSAPSNVAEPDLQALPGAPYNLPPASFGASFNHSALTVATDLPVDPSDSALFLSKTSLTAIAAPGDFVRYELALENTATGGFASNVRVVDQLPPGVRYVSDSTTLDGIGVSDPVISPDLQTLEFIMGNVAGGSRQEIQYVVEIVSGARSTELVNTATAVADAGLVSNESSALIRLTEDLFRSTSTLIGRVVEGSCTEETFSEDQGVGNIRIYLEDGRFAVSDEGGRFHFEGLKPGTHVAQIDGDSVPEFYDVIACETAPGFAGRADSQFVKLSRGSLNRADFYLRRKEAPVGQVNIAMRNVAKDSADKVEYVLDLNGTGKVEIADLQVALLLPDGVTYAPGSMRVDGASVVDPRVAGPSMNIGLTEQFGDWHRELRFTANLAETVHGEMVTKAFANFVSADGEPQKTSIVQTSMQREPAVLDNEGYVLNLTFAVMSAELSREDQLQLDSLVASWKGVRKVQIAAVGHSDSNRVSTASRRIFADNYILSQARARAAAGYIADRLNVSADNIQVEGRGPDDPIASNATAEGRQSNRRVEMILSGMRPTRPSFLDVTEATSETVITETRGAVPGSDVHPLQSRMDAIRDDQTGMPASQVLPNIGTLSPGFEMLLPAADFQPAIPATKISVQHSPKDKLRLEINGAPVSALNFTGMVSNADNTVAISSWAGVDLVDGKNAIRATLSSADGGIDEVLERTINYSGSAIRGEIIRDMSVLVADGNTRPVVAVRLFDRSGKPARKGTTGTYRVQSPYRSWWDVEKDRKNAIVDIANREPSYRVGAEGIAYIELEPTTHTGELVLDFRFDYQREQELRTWLSAEPRDWILVGFAEGTVGYATLSDNQVAAADAGIEDGYYDDGRVAFFAKGQVKGEYLLTLAYDSARDKEAAMKQFRTEVDPNAYYMLYADRSEQRFEAASQRKLYVKLERQQFFALFGDFNTGLSFTELSRYERHFNGFKSGYRGENVGYTVFAAETNYSFVRDELRGDGTSGLYFLSSAPIVGNSETIKIEVRDRYDTGRVVSSTTLTRFLDYNLDNLDGSIYFKRPIPSRDPQFNPVFIVAEYESISDNNADIVAGGRGSVRFADDAVEVGLTHINDGQLGAEQDLTGLDLRWQVNPETLVRAEYATTNKTDAGSQLSGSASAVYLEHNSESVDLRAYIKEVESDFGLGFQSAAETGVRELGVDGRAKVRDNWFVDGEAGWQQNLTTETIRTTLRGQVRYERNGFTGTTGILHAQDDFIDGVSNTSNLGELGVSQRVLNGKLTLRANGRMELAGVAGSLDYPTSFILGADYKVMDGVELFGEFENASGRDIEATMSRVGVRAKPWSRGQINSSVTNASTDFGPRVFANLGLIQGFQLTENWIVDIGFDQTSTILDSNARPFDEDWELGSGSYNDDFRATFVGATYSADLWSANGRLEHRTSDAEERLGLIAGWYRDPQAGHGMSAGLALFASDNISGAETTTANFKYGWAWRKAGGKWSFLNRIDLILEQVDLIDQQQKSNRVINNFNANRRMSENSQLALQYAFKYVTSDFGGLQFSGYTDLIGLDYRRGFATHWDIGAHTSIYHSYQSSIYDYGAGLDVGYNVRDNMWITLGYNITGFHDEDFASARYTAQGPFLRFSIKADQQTLKDIAGKR